MKKGLNLLSGVTKNINIYTETDTETQGCAKFDSDTDTRHFGMAIPD